MIKEPPLESQGVKYQMVEEQCWRAGMKRCSFCTGIHAAGHHGGVRMIYNVALLGEHEVCSPKVQLRISYLPGPIFSDHNKLQISDLRQAVDASHSIG